MNKFNQKLNKFLSNDLAAYSILGIVIMTVILCLWVAISATGRTAIMSEEVNVFPHEKEVHNLGTQYVWNDTNSYQQQDMYLSWMSINDIVHDTATGFNYIEYDYADQLDIEGPYYLYVLIPTSMNDKFLEVYTEGGDDDYDEPLYRIGVTYDRGYTFAELMPY